MERATPVAHVPAAFAGPIFIPQTGSVTVEGSWFEWVPEWLRADDSCISSLSLSSRLANPHFLQTDASATAVFYALQQLKSRAEAEGRGLQAPNPSAVRFTWKPGASSRRHSPCRNYTFRPCHIHRLFRRMLCIS